MKKFISVILIFVLIMSLLAGCGNTKQDVITKNEEKTADDGSLKINTEYTAGDLKFTLFEIDTCEDLVPVSGGDSYYSADSGYCFIDVILDVTNNGDSEFVACDNITGYFKSSDGTKYEDIKTGLEDEDDYVNPYDSLKQGAKGRLHIACQVPCDITKGKMTFEIQKKSFTAKYDSTVEVSSRISNATQISLGNDYTSGDVNFSLYKVTASDKVRVAGNSTHYDADDGMNYVDIVINVTNNGNRDFSADDSIYGFFKTDNTKYENSLLGVESDGKINRYDTIKSLSTGKVHIGFEIPADITAGKAYFTINEKTFAFDFDASVKVSSEVTVEINKEVKLEDFGSFKITDIEFTDKVLPKDTSDEFSYYYVDNSDDYAYFAVHFDLSNLSSNSICANDMMSITAIFNGKYEYNLFMAVDKKDGTGFDEARSTYIIPLETRTAVFLFQVPKQVQDMDYELSICFMGNEYTLTK